MANAFRHLDLSRHDGTIRKAAEDLQGIAYAVRTAERWTKWGPWWVKALAVVSVLLGLLASFVGGVVYTRSGLVMTSEVGCHYLGGQWSPKQDGSGSVCWR